MAWVGQLLMAAVKFWESRLIEEMTLATLLTISKWEGSISAQRPQPRQRLDKTESFCKSTEIEVSSVWFWFELEELIGEDIADWLILKKIKD